MKKKLVSVLMVAAMTASLVACGSNEAASTTTTDASASSQATTTDAAPAEAYKQEKIVMVVDGTLTASADNGQADFEAQWEKAVSEKAGYPVDLEIQQLDHSGYVDAVGRLFAAGDLPDVILLSANMYAQYAPTGYLWDMSEAYANADFQSRVKKTSPNENNTINGAMYGFTPVSGNGCVTYVKESWMDAVGVDKASVTDFASYYDMLLKFAKEDPDGNGTAGDTYGVLAAGIISNEAPYINYFPEFWQDAYPAITQGADGKWYDGFQSDATKAALLRFQQAYADGIIEPTVFTAGTKDVRELYWSADQKGSFGAFTYWAGYWIDTIINNLGKNDLDNRIVTLAPIKETGKYLERFAPSWCIIDDQDGDNTREQAIFDLFIETMVDGNTIETLWAYGAEDVHWSTKAESFKTNEGTSKEKSYEYEEGKFHCKQSLNDPNTLWSKNAFDIRLGVVPLENGFYASTDDADASSKVFNDNCVMQPQNVASETFTNESGNILDAQKAVIDSVVLNGGDVDAAMAKYVETVGSIVDQIIGELNQ